MRDFLNNILQFLNAESLTDAEFATVTAPFMLYDQKTFDDLSRILASRELLTDLTNRLAAYYLAKGATLAAFKKPAKSNIFIGSPL